MLSVDELIENYYNKFVGLPNNNPIVRSNQKNDAFELVVLEALYGKELDINLSKMETNNIERLTKYIVAPPDSGIDIVVEHESTDGNTFDFIQVKNKEMTPIEIKSALLYMENTVKNYLKKRNSAGKNLQEVLSNTSLSDNDNNCKYIIVHRGSINYIDDQKDNKQLIINGADFEIIREESRNTIPRVSEETFGSDSFNNFSLYEESEGNPAILMNICGFDLAKLALKFSNTSQGRNILFGQNLRESLSKSKTYDGMSETIKREPQNFWFYNNGITVIAEDYNVMARDDNSVEEITLKNFSIINGAQTTSALGKFLKNANINGDECSINQLKKVFILTRILKVQDDNFKSQIAIYNNTQNPITTRDMASNRKEQLQLNNNLISDPEPNIYVEIRRGMTAPKNIRLYKHQNTTNIELAQLAYAGFLKDPFTAKDKKNAIFDTDYKQTEGYLINEHYHRLFNNDCNKGSLGILFTKGKEEINELLFINYLYKNSKKMYLTEFKKRIIELRDSMDGCVDDTSKEDKLDQIVLCERLKAIANICIFYCIAYYYLFKEIFPKTDVGLLYNYKKFYSDKDFQNKLISTFLDVFLSGTVRIICNLAEHSPNLNTWVRDKKSAKLFLDYAKKNIQIDMEQKRKYEEYINQFKI